MVELFKSVFHHQYEAVFRTLQHCLDECSDSDWAQPVANREFSQVAFHSLFFADLYLGADLDAIEQQPFHADHADVFAGYEEWEDREPENRYEKSFIQLYLNHCRGKSRQVIDELTDDLLVAPSPFDWIKGSTAEVHVYNIRHIQHHAAQMSLRLRLNSRVDVPWVKSGWE